jgi:hypothetical protein
MSAQRAIEPDELPENEMLDVETSAAILRWLETAEVPDGIEPGRWERWANDGCRGPIEANGVRVTAAMLGHWARSGSIL